MGPLAIVLAGPAVAATGERVKFDAEQALARSQSAIGVQLDDHRFVDTRGRTVGLGGLRDKPLVLSLVYTSCPDTCSVVTRNLAHTVEAAREALGEASFSVATVGFDPGFDTPEQMRMYADRQGVSMSDWRFLSGDPRTVQRLLDQLGFTYVDLAARIRPPRADDRDRRRRDASTARSTATASRCRPSSSRSRRWRSAGRPGVTALGDWIDRVKLLCTVYDSAAGRYRFDYSIFVAAGVGVLCLGAVGVFIVRAWRDGARAGRSA